MVILVALILVALLVVAFVIMFRTPASPLPQAEQAERKVIAEGVYDRADYFSCRYNGRTVIHFDDGRTCLLYDGYHEMTHPRGTRIRISSLDHGEYFSVEKIEDQQEGC